MAYEKNSHNGELHRLVITPRYDIIQTHKHDRVALLFQLLCRSPSLLCFRESGLTLLEVKQIVQLPGGQLRTSVPKAEY